MVKKKVSKSKKAQIAELLNARIDGLYDRVPRSGKSDSAVKALAEEIIKIK